MGGAGAISSVCPAHLLMKHESTEAARSRFSSGTARKNSLTTKELGDGEGKGSSGDDGSRTLSFRQHSREDSLKKKASCRSSLGDVIDFLLEDGDGGGSSNKGSVRLGESVTVMQGAS